MVFKLEICFYGFMFFWFLGLCLESQKISQKHDYTDKGSVV